MMKKNLFSVVVASGAVTVGLMTAAPAEAVKLYKFSYTLQSGGMLGGQLEGLLQPDNDTVVVSTIINPTFNTATVPDLPFVRSSSEFAGGGAPADPVVSFSGSNMDIIACRTSSCSEGFAFDFIGAFGPPPTYASSLTYGDAFEPYDPSRWTLAADAVAIPTPAPLLGLLGMGWATIRKARKQQHSE